MSTRFRSAQFHKLLRFVESHPGLCVLTGAGVSTASGIPDYRDHNGEWKRPEPVQYRDFIAKDATRQRYWARSLVGWPWFKRAKPNAAHKAIAHLEQAGQVQQLITQNVDRLHQNAGSRNVIDLHGRLDQIICLDCAALTPREPLQQRMLDENPDFAGLTAEIAPDGDAYVKSVDFCRFRVPVCESCGGVLKPDVVFFGETIPAGRVESALQGLYAADALLILGSSLMVYSGYRFCLKAAERGLPTAAVNLGRTRADELLDLKIEENCEPILEELIKSCA
jgi:NAD-dependent SIR2 family protein deacetylase